MRYFYETNPSPDARLRAAFKRAHDLTEFRAPTDPNPDPPIWFYVNGRYMRASEFYRRYGRAIPEHWQHEGATPED